MISPRITSYCLVALCLLGDVAQLADGQDETPNSFSPHQNPPDLSRVSDALWERIDTSVELGLAYLTNQQTPDGSVETLDSARPAVTALVAVAGLSAGHQPGSGPYGEQINRMVDFVLSTQREDGLFSLLPPTAPLTDWTGPTHLATYNHCICGMMLGEVYGATDPVRAAKVKLAVERALKLARRWQTADVPESEAGDRGGIRYLKIQTNAPIYADLSVTSWLMMFYRSANNAGFNVPQAWMDSALDYTKRCFEPETGGFRYARRYDTIFRGDSVTRGMTGAGVTMLFLSGRYDADIEAAAGDWIAAQDFTRFNASENGNDRYFYACYYCSQAAYQLGGDYWATIYPPIAETLVANQRTNGAWAPDHAQYQYGSTYSTTMAVLALTPPYQLLPIYQR